MATGLLLVADYQVPAIMDAWLATVPPNVSQGSLVNVDLFVENIANVLTAHGADELDYTLNDDNIPAGNPGTAMATWEFDITGATSLQVSIDMGAMGDFEDGADMFDWTYSIDGGAAQPLFTSSVDEASSANYTMAGGAVVNLNDPLRMTDTAGTTTELSNVFQTLTSLLTGAGGALSLELTATANGGSEAYAFDNILIEGFTGGDFLEADFTKNGDVDAADLAQWRGDFGLGGGSDADDDGDSDGADFLIWQRQFGMNTNAVPLSHAVPDPNTMLLPGFAIASVFWSRRFASERPRRGKRQCFPPRGRFSCLLGMLLVLPAVALADPYDPPAGYYHSATGTGATLKSQLHNIIDNHTIRSYDAAVGGDGSTHSTVNLGRILVGAATPAAQSVSVNKNGNDGTYFEVSTTGAATSSLGGPAREGPTTRRSTWGSPRAPQPPVRVAAR